MSPTSTKSKLKLPFDPVIPFALVVVLVATKSSSVDVIPLDILILSPEFTPTKPVPLPPHLHLLRLFLQLHHHLIDLNKMGV